MPAMVIEAHRKRFNPSIGPKRSLIDRWSCSIRLFKYFEDRILVRLPRRCCAEDFSRRPMRSLVAIKRDRARRPPLVLERSPEKRLGGRDIPLGAEQEIDSLSLLVDRAIEVSPAALDLHVGFIDPPGSASSACEAVPALSNSGT